ncbi:hypothetical protein [Eubacterium sp.]|uniref:hypothetical protein n=1 Tax=Eubacterium sp. TaxID=142586 RepID=UPI0025EDA030|nr:hypothetical protein [Eubacterium sp.]MCR5628188.1 hypothetical protein [Eubacterium sp.]
MSDFLKKKVCIAKLDKKSKIAFMLNALWAGIIVAYVNLVKTLNIGWIIGMVAFQSVYLLFTCILLISKSK